MRLMMTGLMIWGLAGCAANSGDYCDISKIIWWDSVDELQNTPTGVKRQIIEHNAVHDKLCK